MRSLSLIPTTKILLRFVFSGALKIRFPCKITEDVDRKFYFLSFSLSLKRQHKSVHSEQKEHNFPFSILSK